MSKNKSLILVSVLYLLLTIFMTFPLVLNLTSHIPGVSEDGPIHVWHLWWLRHSVFELKSNPIVTNYVFWPQTVNTIFDAHTFTNALISLPLQPIFGLILTSNLIIITSLTLSGVGTYLLVKYLLNDHLSAFTAGIIFAFPPYVFAHLLDGHTNLITTWPIPFYVLFLIKTLENLRWKDAAAAGVLLGLLSLNDYTYAAFSLILTGLILLYRFLTKWRHLFNFKTISRLVLMSVVWLLIFSPLAVPALKTFFGGFQPGVPLWVQDFYAADIVWFLKPSPLHPLLGRLAPIPKLGIIESTISLGWSVIFLSLVGTMLVLMSKQRSGLRLWVFLAAALFLLTLGPSLHVNGAYEWWFGAFRLMIPLPYILVHALPFIGGTQEPARMASVLMLPLAVLAAFALKSLTSGFSGFLKLVAVEIVSVIIIFEFLAIPFPLNKMEVPSVYYEIAKDEGDFAVMNLPLGWNNNDEALGQTVLGNLQYYQVVHQHPILRGTVARLPNENFDFYRKTPGMDFLIYPASCNYSMTGELAEVRQALADFKVKYIVVFPNLFPSGSVPDLSCLAWMTGYEKFYRDLEVVGFRWTSQ